jgi:hypothetical protein
MNIQGTSSLLSWLLTLVPLQIGLSHERCWFRICDFLQLPKVHREFVRWRRQERAYQKSVVGGRNECDGVRGGIPWDSRTCVSPAETYDIIG